MRTKKKEKRRRLTGEKTIRCCGQGENMEKYGFGVDVGGTSCKLGLFTDSGKLMEKWEIPTDTSEQGEHIIEHVAASLESRQRERGLADEQIIGVGIDTPGIAGRDGVVRGAVNLGWEACPVQEQLKMRLQKKVCVCNDANAAALGELWQGGGRGYRDMVMVTLGTGVGGAVILNGKVLAGAHGIAGEIGHMTVFHKEIERCACGKYGCVEQYASAKGLIRITRQLLEKKDPYTILVDTPELSAKQILDAAKRGDRLALDAVEVLGRAAAGGYRDMVMVTLGTGVGGAVILNGKVLAGAHGIAGEIGHMTVFHKEIERCACGKYGCVEQYASAKGLIRITRQLLEKKDPYTILVDTPELSAKQILDAAKRGDRLALDAVEVLGKALGSALAAVAEVIDPEVFVIGGGIAGAGEIILRIVQKYYRPDVLPAGADIPFELARLGNDAGMYGSMKLLLDSSDEK